VQEDNIMMPIYFAIPIAAGAAVIVGLSAQFIFKFVMSRYGGKDTGFSEKERTLKKYMEHR
jgi:MFS superfamily sulfate permease-like transporter